MLVAPTDIPHVLDAPPQFHQKLLDYGTRPYWSADGSRIAFIDQHYGDACEIDVETGKVRDLTRGLGKYHAFLRILILSNGDYLLIGPRDFKSTQISRHKESELWVLDKNLRYPPKPLGRRIREGAGVSALEPKITYAVTGLNDPSIGSPDVYECHITDIVYGDDGAELGPDTIFYRTRAGASPEPQDFRHDDTEVIFAEYSRHRVKGVTPEPNCVVKGYRLDNKEITTYISEGMAHNEPEGIFPDHDYICLESDCDNSGLSVKNLWKLKLDGSQERVRMTSMPEGHDWKATNSNVSADGRWLAFMVALQSDESGYGRGLGLLDLKGWEQTPEAQDWETPTSLAQSRLDAAWKG